MGKNDFNQLGLTVAYPNADGSGTVLEGGSHAWRNNNPGNLEEVFRITADGGERGSFHSR